MKVVVVQFLVREIHLILKIILTKYTRTQYAGMEYYVVAIQNRAGREWAVKIIAVQFLVR